MWSNSTETQLHEIGFSAIAQRHKEKIGCSLLSLLRMINFIVVA